jgi:hypothetical protein
MTATDTIILTESESGILTDQYGNTWSPFSVDYFAEQFPGECCICGEETESGYMNLDCGGEEAHEHCVTFAESDNA